MKKFTFLLLTALIAGAANAQTLQWQWAKSGGDQYHHTTMGGSNLTAKEMEQIVGLEVDKNNNTYFAAQIGGADNLGIEFDGMIIPTYNTTYDWWDPDWSFRDIMLGKLDCEGNLLWHYIIGSKGDDIITGFGIDTLGGVFVDISSNPRNTNYNDTLYFRNNNNVIDTLFVSLKDQIGHSRFLIRLDTLGELQLINEPVPGLVDIVGLEVEPDGTLHRLITAVFSSEIIDSYSPATFENGQIVIDSAFLSVSTALVARYDRDLNYLDYVQLPVKNMTCSKNFDNNNFYFKYDNINQKYYLAGYLGFASRSWNGDGIDGMYHVVIDGDTIYSFTFVSDGECYLAAFDYNGNHLWHQKGKPSDVVKLPQIHSLTVDNEGFIYINFYGKNFGNTEIDNSQNKIIKINSNSNIEWHSKVYDLPVPYTIAIRYFVKNNAQTNNVAVSGNRIYFEYNGQWVGCTDPDINMSKLFVSEYDKNTGEQISNSEWLSEANYYGNTTYNLVTSIAANKNDDYIIGGMVATKYNLNPENPDIMIKQGGGDTDFFIGKFGSHGCDYIPPSKNEETLADKTATKLYPNPASVEFTVNNETSRIKRVVLLDVLGRAVSRTRLQTPDYKATINVSGLANGVYFVTVETEKGNETVKLIKK
ncbi:MAG: T9SS type A sorting domain-containing protein [Prevotellaceae bacterium]|jgi:hypothetical protein|nr:T9SS type A sorting domain-containing protein [Prevotellaceae bacterium]